MLRALLLILFLCEFAIGVCQRPFYVHYTSLDGLGSNETFDIKQDSTGFIWIGTDKGLTRFDGTTFKNFTTKHGLPGNTITKLYLGNEGDLWCMAHGAGLSQYTGDSIQIPKWDSLISPRAEYLYNFHLFDSAHFFIGFHGKSFQEAAFYEMKNEKIVASKIVREFSPDSNYVMYNSKGSTGFFAISNAGHSRFLTLIDDLGNRSHVDLTDTLPIPRNHISGTNGAVFCIMNDWVYKIHHGEVSRCHLPFPTTSSLYLDSKQHLWVGTYEGGAFQFPYGDLSQPPVRYMNSLSITSVFEDRDGGLWFSSAEEGIYHLPYRNLSVYDYASGLPEKRVTNVLCNKDTLWMIYRNGAITATTLDSEETTIEQIADYRYVFGALIDDSDRLNVSIDKPGEQKVDGVAEWPPASYLLQDRDSALLASTSGPIVIFKRDNKRWKRIDTLGRGILPRVYSVTKKEPGIYYLSTKKGLYLLDGQDLSYLGDQDDFFKKGIGHSVKYNDKFLFSIPGIGLLLKSETESLLLNTDNVLTNDFIINIEVDGDSIWLCTSDGIDMLNMGEMENGLPKTLHIGIDQGLPNPTVNDIEVFDNEIWVLTDDGVAIIPKDILTPQRPPSIYCTSIEVNGLSQKIQPRMEFSHTENNLQIGYQAISFKSGEAQRYFYRLNKNAPWSSTLANVLNFSNLSPGNYQIEIRTSRVEENPKAVLSFNVTIMTPLWQRWYSIVTMVVLLGLMIWGYFLNRIAIIERRSEYEKQISTLSYRALRAQMNPHFIYNALNAIQNFIINKDQEASIAYLSSFSKLIRSIFENSGKDAIYISEELKSIELYVQLEQARYPERFHLEIEVSEKAKSVKIAPMIIQPFIENAILHGVLPQKKKGLLTLKLTLNPGYVNVVIEDNGIGISKGRKIGEKKKRYLKGKNQRQSGMSVTKERIIELAARNKIEAHFKAIDLTESEESGTGTRVSFNLPYLSGND